MAEVVVAPDVEALAVSFLNASLTPPVATRIPNPRPATFVRVLLVGGAGRTSRVLHRATLVVEAWATKDTDASDLAMTADAYMLAWPDLSDDVYAVEQFAGMSNLPDPVSSSPRYTATYQVTARAAAL